MKKWGQTIGTLPRTFCYGWEQRIQVVTRKQCEVKQRFLDGCCLLQGER